MFGFVVLLAVLLFGCSTANKNYGCKFRPNLCDYNTQYCANDGMAGICTEFDSQPVYNGDPNTKHHDIRSLSKFSDGDDLNNLNIKPTKISKESLDELVGLVKRVRDYLKQSGIDFSDLTPDEIEDLSVVISRIHNTELEANQEARTKRLAELIIKAKKMLINNGVDITQLSDQQIKVISNQLAAIFQRSEKKRMQISKKLQNPNLKSGGGNYNVGNKNIPVDEGPELDKPNIDDGQNIKLDIKEDTENAKISEVNDNHIVTSQKDGIDGISGKDNDKKEDKENDKHDAEQSSEVVSAGLKEKGDGDIKGQSEILDSNSDVSLSEDMSNVKIDKADEKELTYIIIVIVVVIVIILIIIGSFVFFCMKSAEKRNKLIGAASEQSDDDYQELCRQHYASRNSETSNTREPLLKEGVGSVTSQSRVFSPVSQRSRHSKMSRNSSVSSWGEEPVSNTLDISTAHAILSYMEDHLNNEDRLNAEWMALCSYEADRVSTKHGEKEVSRNRHQRAIPFDHNRVVLKDKNNPMEGDYINASFIIDNDPRTPVYIAAQGPLSHTIHQFWQMVWEQKCVAIVMLSPLVEDGISQCARYWPDEGSCTYNNFEIHLVSEHVWCEDYLVRSLYSKDLSTGETRTLTQFHFLSWPHDGVPLSPKPLLELRRKVSKCVRGNSPVLIHCDDGVGRTGCYILIDLVVQRMLKGQAKEIDVAASLEHLRDQRRGMLTTKEQLEFSLASVADEANAVLKVLLK